MAIPAVRSSQSTAGFRRHAVTERGAMGSRGALAMVDVVGRGPASVRSPL